MVQDGERADLRIVRFPPGRLAEQNTNMALKYATYGYILENGRVVMEGPATALRENEDVREFYLGTAGKSRKSFRDVVTDRRPKRWPTDG
ncbi:hypothetical protein AC629_27005 [Bradyrhizobium sp. NAS80.1]|nr:hypothetical protein AC629_27005 [Bradyrhizobium sp. NAS80.1]